MSQKVVVRGVDEKNKKNFGFSTKSWKYAKKIGKNSILTVRCTEISFHFGKSK